MRNALLYIVLTSYLFPQEAVKNLDLERFMGKWFVISIIPNSIEEGCENSSDTYTLNKDGSISVVYNATKNGEKVILRQRAKVIDTTHKSTWKLRFTKPFIPFFRAPFKVIAIDDQYSYMVVGYPENKYGWVMSRTQTMDDQLYSQILSRLESDFGYNTNLFTKVIHK